MSLAPLQSQLLAVIQAAVEDRENRIVTYREEYLGYLPFGLYRWIEAEETEISFPPDWSLDWSSRDLEALTQAGYLKRIAEWQNPEDRDEKSVSYEVKLIE